MKELGENFDEWREVFESKGMRVNLGKTKLNEMARSGKDNDHTNSANSVDGDDTGSNMWYDNMIILRKIIILLILQSGRNFVLVGYIIVLGTYLH